MTGPSARDPQPAPGEPQGGGEPTSVSFTLPNRDHDIDGLDEYGDETGGPGWEIPDIPGGVVVPTVEGIAIEGELHDDVGRLEEAAQKLLAAVAWHEWFARSDAAPSVPPQPTVPRAPVEALLAALDRRRRVLWQDVDDAVAEVRRHLDGEGS